MESEYQVIHAAEYVRSTSTHTWNRVLPITCNQHQPHAIWRIYPEITCQSAKPSHLTIIIYPWHDRHWHWQTSTKKAIWSVLFPFILKVSQEEKITFDTPYSVQGIKLVTCQITVCHLVRWNRTVGDMDHLGLIRIQVVCRLTLPFLLSVEGT